MRGVNQIDIVDAAHPISVELEERVVAVDPVTDSRWAKFVFQDRNSSIFHRPEWLKSLRDTYGYPCLAFALSNAKEITDALVFCEVRSWITGSRLVSLPFSDHCQPLAESGKIEVILDFVRDYAKNSRTRYVEIRPLSADNWRNSRGFGIADTYGFHYIDLRPDLQEIFRRFHESCIRRKIKKAEREDLSLEQGNSEALLRKFRHLLLLTRRRHRLPPQPAAWFENLAKNFGDDLTIHVLSKDSRPIASILTLSHKECLTYKYGCSDAEFHNLGGMPLLFWKVIQHAKEQGFTNLDLGRSSAEDPGLVAFKSHLGGIHSELRYYRSPAPIIENGSVGSSFKRYAQAAVAHLPEPLLVGAGNFIYRHLG